MGADVNLGEGSDGKPVDAALTAADYELLKVLVDAGAELSKANARKIDAALLKSAAGGELMSVEHLLGLGGNPRAKDDSGRNAMDQAVATFRHQVVERLLEDSVKLTAIQKRRLAEDAIDHGRSIGNREKEGIEEAIWSTCVTLRNSRAAYEYYLRSYPESAGRARAEDAMAYAMAEQTGEISGYENYLALYPAGMFRREAKSQLSAYGRSLPGATLRALESISTFLVRGAVQVLIANPRGAVSKIFIEESHRLVIDFSFEESKVLNSEYHGLLRFSWSGKIGQMSGKDIECEGGMVKSAGVFYAKELHADIVSNPNQGSNPDSLHILVGATMMLGPGSLVFQGTVEFNGVDYEFKQGRISVSKNDLTAGQYVEGTVVVASGEVYQYHDGRWVTMKVAPLVFK